jgi:bis(5'-adenosyl)-triphosphatase
MKELTSADTSGPQDCPFCSSALQHTAFRADELFLAVYNIAPVLPGHSLVLPRAHVASVLTLDEADLTALVVFARRTTRLLTHAFAADGFDWTIQDGRSAGQSVPHLHLHIIPRHMGDLPEPGDWYPALMANEGATIDSAVRPRLTPAEHERITRRLREFAIREQ